MPTFNEFITQYINDNSANGDLARYVSRQENFPRDYGAIRKRLEGTAYLDTFERVYSGEYMTVLRDYRRVREALKIRDTVFYKTHCFKDEKALRYALRRRVEIALLSTIAKGLFDIADAIREHR